MDEKTRQRVIREAFDKQRADGGWAMEAMGPFKTHPNLDLYISSGSPHPKENFGCTSCHAGLDRATSFQNASHIFWQIGPTNFAYLGGGSACGHLEGVSPW